MQQKDRIPSNRMTAYIPRRASGIAWLFLAAIGTGLVYLCISKPMFLVVVVFIAAVSWILNVAENRRQQRIAAERRSESICTFARAFDFRTLDTWIVRAVFEEITTCVQFPIRPEDRLEADLKFDSDDIDDLAEAIAQRIGCPLDQCEQNPLYGKVKTVRELVEFFVRQSQRSRPAA